MLPPRPRPPPNGTARATRTRHRCASGSGWSSPIPPSARPACAVAAAACFVLATSWPQYELGPTQPFDTSTLPVTVVVPALNEEACIEDCMRSIAALRPPPAAVVVAVGPSTDRTAALARRHGAVVVRGARGRAAQMNSGAAAAPRPRSAPADPAAPPSALLFLHADSRLPPDAVSLVRAALARRGVLGGGFCSLIESGERTWWLQSLHNVLKAHYLPLLLRPRSHFAGLRVLFGDQAMFARTDAFERVGGFDASVPIMEDADMCLKLHAAGPPPWSRPPDASPGRAVRPRPLRAAPRGRLLLINRCVATDGRRFERWGNGRATLIHYLIGIAWYAGASGERMRQLYERVYGDVRDSVRGSAVAPTAS